MPITVAILTGMMTTKNIEVLRVHLSKGRYPWPLVRPLHWRAPIALHLRGWRKPMQLAGHFGWLIHDKYRKEQ